MRYLDWEDIWAGFLLITAFIIVIGLTILAFKDAKLERYELGSSTIENIGRVYTIHKVINWGCDETIYLPNTTLQDAIIAVDSLNKTIK